MSKNIPVRIPDDLYEQIVASKPEDLPLSTWLLKIIRKGLDVGVESTYTNVDNVDKSRLESKLEEKLASLVSTINQKFVEQEQRIESLEKLEA